MKPITHPLAIMALNEYVNGCRGTVEDRASEGWRDRMFLFRQWSEAGCPLYADPTPMPAPALGMRVYRMSVDAGGCQHARPPVDVTYCRAGVGWADYCDDPENITLITDFRTGEVLWRRS